MLKLSNLFFKEMLLGGVAGGVYQPQHESPGNSSSNTPTPSNTTATLACSVQVRVITEYKIYSCRNLKLKYKRTLIIL